LPGAHAWVLLTPRTISAVPGAGCGRTIETKSRAHAGVPRFEPAFVRATVILDRAHLQEAGNRSAYRFPQRNARRARTGQSRRAESAAGKNARRCGEGSD